MKLCSVVTSISIVIILVNPTYSNPTTVPGEAAAFETTTATNKTTDGDRGLVLFRRVNSGNLPDQNSNNNRDENSGNGLNNNDRTVSVRAENVDGDMFWAEIPDDDSGLSGGGIAGIVAAVAVFVVVLIVIIIVYIRSIGGLKRKLEKSPHYGHHSSSRPNNVYVVPQPTNRRRGRNYRRRHGNRRRPAPELRTHDASRGTVSTSDGGLYNPPQYTVDRYPTAPPPPYNPSSEFRV